MGKSTVSSMFHEDGIPVFDADQVMHYIEISSLFS
jgi:dephospho-CoA kinase